MSSHRIRRAPLQVSPPPARPLLACVLLAGIVTGPSDAAAQMFLKLTTVTAPGNPIVADPGTATNAIYAGASWGDIDRDGWPDLVVARRDLYRNLGAGAFARWIGAPLQPTTAQGTSFADIDDDGDPDLLLVGGIAAGGPPLRGGSGVYRNDAGTFVRVSAGATADSVAIPGWSGAFADYDLDGHADFVVVAADGFTSTGFTNQLLRGVGDGTFVVDASTDVSVGLDSYTIGTWSDCDLDGDVDLSIGAGPGGAGVSPDYFYRNRTREGGAPRLQNESLPPVATVSRDGQVWNWIDDDNDGDLDLFITNYGFLANELFRNVGGAYVKQTVAQVGPIVGDLAPSLASVWGDFDNDGDLDALVTNDATQRNRYYRNNGAGLYTAVGMGTLTTEIGPHHCAVAADYDRDGDLDLFQSAPGTAKGLYRNDLPAGNHWIELALRGVTSNGAALGARVRVKATIGGVPRWQMREVSAQNSFNGHSDQTLHFGLGDASIIDSLVIHWPGGGIEVAEGVPADTIRVLVQGELTPTPVRLAPVGATVVDRAVRVSWYSAADAPGRLTVERRDGPTVEGAGGDWFARAEVGVGAGGIVLYADSDVRAGETYAYRLAYTGDLGPATTEPIEVTVPVDRLALRLAGSNPVRGHGDLRFVLTAPAGGRASLELWDVAGRRRGSSGPIVVAGGEQSIRFRAADRLEAGVYFARLRLGAGVAETRVLLIP